MADRGIAWGLLGPREADRLWDRHILNSVAPQALIPAGVAVADVGSGAGLPGIPLAILRPDLRITLIEPLLRRCTFLSQTVDELGITAQVTIVRGRAEDHDQTYEVVLSRALAPLEKLVTRCGPLLSRRGIILAIKGRSAPNELAAAAAFLTRNGLAGEALQVRAHPTAEPTYAIRIVRTPR